LTSQSGLGRSKLSSSDSASGPLLALAKDISNKSVVTTYDVYKTLRAALALTAKQVGDEKSGEKREEVEAHLDAVMAFTTAAQELISLLKFDPSEGGRIRQLVNKFASAIRTAAERAPADAPLPSASSKDKCSICDAKLTEKELETAEKTKSIMCAKCVAPLGSMQTTFDDLLRSVQ
jgi:hypothetical protein